MAFERFPYSEKWKEILAIEDETKQSREICRYVYDLEAEIRNHKSEQDKIKELEKQIKEMKKQILSLGVVQEAIKEAEDRTFENCNQDWSGLQGSF